ncbi:4694_t:CDS:1, partial [Ambispora leptoticha]
GAVNAEIFTNFVNDVKLPTDEKYYLLLDKLKVHEAKKVEKALKDKNIEPRFIVTANPWLNPIEEVFHVIKKYVESQEPRTYEDLKKIISEKINELQEKGLTKYFKDCLDFDFILKSGH